MRKVVRADHAWVPASVSSGVPKCVVDVELFGGLENREWHRMGCNVPNALPVTLEGAGVAVVSGQFIGSFLSWHPISTNQPKLFFDPNHPIILNITVASTVKIQRIIQSPVILTTKGAHPASRCRSRQSMTQVTLCSPRS